jgi:hypothetical protein
LKKYPAILSEDVTLEEASRVSIARFGDGEWRCAVGGGCTSQRPDVALSRELQHILLRPNGCLVCLPNVFNGCPRKVSWIRYTEERYVKYCGAKTYGSAFITRPDNAPWIDRPDYWERVHGLWRGAEIVLVVGDKKSITTEMIGTEALSVREVIGPRQHAYAEIDRIEEEIGPTNARVLLCLGATATVLAYRLSVKGIHAIDLGHIGMFMKHAGAYRYSQNDVASDDYRALLTKMHQSQSWGNAGKSHAPEVEALAKTIDAKTILDYGCGTNTLAGAMAPRRVSGYDPGIPERAMMPKPCELVVCTDVLEHIEPDKLDAVLDHIFNLTGKAAYFVISTRPAKAILPDGRNAHICLHDPEWWLAKLVAVGWVIARSEGRKGLNVWAYKP